MSWRKDINWSPKGLGKASYKGAGFFIDTSEIQVGRITIPHIPGGQGISDKELLVAWGGGVAMTRSTVWSSDVGPAQDEVHVTGYVIANADNGWSHFKDRDFLIAMLKEGGPGNLHHPYYGDMYVTLSGKAKITESFTNNLGIARFDMIFFQYEEPLFKKSLVNFIDSVDLSVLETINAALDGFTQLMNQIGSFTGELLGPITSMLNKVQGAINAVKGAVASTISAVTGFISSSLSLVNNLLNSPCDLANMMIDVGRSAQGLVGMAGDVITGGIIGKCSGQLRGDVTKMDGSYVPEILGISVVEQITTVSIFDTDDLPSVPTEQADNTALLATVSQVGMIAIACQVAIRILFSNQEDMQATLDRILAAIDNLIDRLGSSSGSIDDPLLFQKVSQLRSDIVEMMYKKNTDLAKQISYEVPAGVQSSLTLAYDQYGDIEREEEIFSRNRILVKHPGFLPNGEVIKILNE